MRRWHASFALVFLVAGCHARRAGKLVGEIHVHGFAGGVHPAALFLSTPVSADEVDGDSVVPEATGTKRDGCVIVSSDDKSAPPELHVVDAGALRILGGLGVPRVELAFHPGEGYLPVGELPRRELFGGGEPLTYEADGGEAPAFRGSLVAPVPLELYAPAKLTLPGTSLTVRWKPDRAERIQLALIASTRQGRWVAIRCRAVDAAGVFTFPAALVAKLPPPPRDLQLEVTRNQIVRAATAVEGVGVILHASFARKLDGHD